MAAFGGKMKKVWILLLSSLLFINCTAAQINSFQDLNVQFEETENDLLKVTISGFKLTSAPLSIKNYQIEYDDNKVYMKIKESFKNTGISMDYYIQFLMRKNVNEIYLGNELLWTNSVEAYFKNQKLQFPLNINTKVNKNSKINHNNPAQTELSKEELQKINDFIKYFSKNLSFADCQKWKKSAVAFSLSNFGIFEDAGKKHLCVSVNAYSGTAEIFDQAQKLKNMDISVLYNILLFDYDTFEEEGWVF